MECPEALEHFQDFLDEELGKHKASALEAHLHLCPGCAAEFHIQQEMRQAVREKATRHTASPHLRASLRQAETMQVPGWLKWWVPALALLLVLSLGTALYMASLSPRPLAPSPLVVEAVNDYIRLTQRGRPEDMGGPDPPQVVKWFRGKLDFAFNLPPAEEGEFRLVGGELSYYLDRKVACLLYRKGPHLVTLSVLRREGVDVPKGTSMTATGTPLHLASHRGFTVIVWQRNDLLYALVSDLAAQELSPLATSIAQS